LELRRADVISVTVWWSDEALARGGLDRERADEMLALAYELVELPSKVYPGPRAGESADEWADRVLMSRSAPSKKPTKVVHSAAAIDRYVKLWSQMYRDKD
jgi:hypothetical protein